MESQPLLNIGMVGHVSHGKTTVVKAISGTDTKRFQKEHQRNITIYLGYANAKIYYCNNCGNYQGTSSDINEILCENCKIPMINKVHVSFVDCPGHHVLMSTMLSGTCIMDVALLLIAANEKCPQPQTIEHLIALEISEVKQIIILQNKVDLVSREQADENYSQIIDFIKDTIAEDAPIIPISAQRKINIDYLCRLITKIPIPTRNITSMPFGNIIRSFDINRPGTEVKNLHGGVIGGSIHCGRFIKGDEIEIRPGLIIKDDKNNITCHPLSTKIVSIQSERISLEFAQPGGLIAFETLLDPTLTKSDRLKGQVIGKPGTLPPILTIITVKYTLLRRILVGIKSNIHPEYIKNNEILQLSIGSNIVYAKTHQSSKEKAILQLIQPICTNTAQKIVILRKYENKWIMIGFGSIV